MAQEEQPISAGEEDIALSDNELNNILDGAELSEVSLGEKDIDDGSELEASMPEVSSNSEDDSDSESVVLNEDDIPDLSDLEMELDENAIHEDELDDSKIPELESNDSVDSEEEDDLEVPSIDDLDLPDLSDEGISDEELAREVEEENRNLDLPDEQTVKDELSDLPDIESLKNLPDEEDDETVALSESEMDNILSDVDDSSVVELNGDDSEPSGEEPKDIDEFVPDDDRESEEDEDSSPYDEQASVADSMDFEKEIMQDADVEYKKPNTDSEAEESASLPENKTAPRLDEDDEPHLTDDTDKALPSDASLDDIDEDQLSRDLDEAQDQLDQQMAELEDDGLLENDVDIQANTDSLDAIQENDDDHDEEDSVAKSSPEDMAADMEDELENMDIPEEVELPQDYHVPDMNEALEEEESSFDGTITEEDLQMAKVSQDAEGYSGKSNKNPKLFSPKVEDGELYELFKYIDNLLESLPEDKIREFAESKYYDMYIAIINRLGI